MRACILTGLGALALSASSALAGSCPADLNNNGVVNGADLGLLLGAWGPCPGCAADLNGDNVVNGADLGLLLGEWGPCLVTGCPGDGSCYESNGSPGCNDAECCEAVCAIDGFCCDTTWDSLCASEAFDVCGNCGDPGAGDCFASNGSPGCNDADCCESVCADDPFCCNVTWDGLCASSAIDLCPGCGNPEAGDCCSSNGTPFCNDAACCDAVCAIDSFCCDTSWDGVCAGEAQDICEVCPACGNDFAGDCCTSNGTPFCNDEACCDAVCAIDTFCCSTSWDSLCAGEAQDICAACPACGNETAGDCCSSNGTPFCNDEACCEAVCAIDGFCCNTSWDGICAGEAQDICEACPACGNDFAGDCLTSNGSPFCDDEACCVAVCAQDSFCCENTWDGICANEANDICYFGCDGASGNCYESNSSPGCNVFDCCVAVCEIDAFCCNNTWDGICAGEAADICGNCGDPKAGGCFVSNGTPGCDDSACCEPTCAEDPFCCNVSWDGLCADEAAGNCGFAQCPGDGDCFSSNGSPGCNDGSCCELVCAIDSFCCNNNWDSICANEATDICN